MIDKIKSKKLSGRYLAKLIANIIGLIFGLIIQMIIPRSLGPKMYGNYEYLVNFFNKAFPFFTLGTDMGFYTKLSMRQREYGLISFYTYLTGFSIFVLFIFIYTCHVLGLTSIIWLDQTGKYIYMAAIYSALIWIIRILTHTSDAFGLTVFTEFARAAQKLLGLIILASFFLLKILNLEYLFIYYYIISILFIISFIIIFRKSGYYIFQEWSLNKEKIINYIKEFYNYSHPLFFASVISVITELMDHYILQLYGGSIQQGFFGLSYRVGAVCFIFTSAMTSLIIREMSVLFNKNDYVGMRKLFSRFGPALFMIAAYIGCFASVEARSISYIFGGSEFIAATIPMAIMSLYPIHQTYGQLTGSILFATGKTKLYRNITIVFMILGLPISYILIAPHNMLGLDIGATGLALKFVGVQLFSVNVMLYFITKILDINYYEFLKYQIVGIFLLLIIAFLSKMLVSELIHENNMIILRFIISGIIYTLVIALIIYFKPYVFGITKSDLTIVVNKVLRKIR